MSTAFVPRAGNIGDKVGPGKCQWCSKPLPPTPSQDHWLNLFCSLACQAEYAKDQLGIDEFYG